MICIRTASRLHFGLFALPSAHGSPWRNHEGQATLPRRHFGGIGLMIEEPGIDLTIEPARTWSATGPLHQRALLFAQQYCGSLRVTDCFHLRMISAAPEHIGLGTGTQLGLAVARGIAELTHQPARDATTLARHVGRGLRSALGVHGFAHGGFLVEGGKTKDAISPLLVRHDFPDDWQIVLITPRNLQGTHGPREIEAFAHLTGQQRDDQMTETLTRLVLLNLLPALLERDLDTFGEALHDFNRRVGALFQHAQGGLYAHPQIEHLVRGIRGAHVKGVGQTSWGPTVFAVVAASEAAGLCDWLVRTYDIRHGEIIVTRACNRSADVVCGEQAQG
jgi:beta-RFAP synthase